MKEEEIPDTTPIESSKYQHDAPFKERTGSLLRWRSLLLRRTQSRLQLLLMRSHCIASTILIDFDAGDNLT